MTNHVRLSRQVRCAGTTSPDADLTLKTPMKADDLTSPDADLTCAGRHLTDVPPLRGTSGRHVVTEMASEEMHSVGMQDMQTDAAAEVGAEVMETSAPGQVIASKAGCDSPVTPLSRPEGSSERIQELATHGPDVADCIREARERLSATSPAMNALEVGDRSVQLQAALAPVRAAIYQATLADLGVSPDGPDRPSEALRITARNLATLDVLAETFWTWIETRGAVTAKGKTRSAVTTLLSIIDRQTKLAAVIGLARKSRDVRHMSIAQFLEHEQQQRQPSEGSQS